MYNSTQSPEKSGVESVLKRFPSRKYVDWSVKSINSITGIPQGDGIGWSNILKSTKSESKDVSSKMLTLCAH